MTYKSLIQRYLDSLVPWFTDFDVPDDLRKLKLYPRGAPANDPNKWGEAFQRPKAVLCIEVYKKDEEPSKKPKERRLDFDVSRFKTMKYMMCVHVQSAPNLYQCYFSFGFDVVSSLPPPSPFHLAVLMPSKWCDVVPRSVAGTSSRIPLQHRYYQ